MLHGCSRHVLTSLPKRGCHRQAETHTLVSTDVPARGKEELGVDAGAGSQITRVSLARERPEADQKHRVLAVDPGSAAVLPGAGALKSLRLIQLWLKSPGLARHRRKQPAQVTDDSTNEDARARWFCPDPNAPKDDSDPSDLYKKKMNELDNAQVVARVKIRNTVKSASAM
ncbi:hypothetical protein C8T65DRAFT_750352 [Cerioporus squamosus]|nr:hypothetical protein C8T65DRAFT_750352 [Cerioporus squamosus]